METLTCKPSPPVPASANSPSPEAPLEATTRIITTRPLRHRQRCSKTTRTRSVRPALVSRALAPSRSRRQAHGLKTAATTHTGPRLAAGAKESIVTNNAAEEEEEERALRLSRSHRVLAHKHRLAKAAPVAAHHARTGTRHRRPVYARTPRPAQSARRPLHHHRGSRPRRRIHQCRASPALRRTTVDPQAGVGPCEGRCSRLTRRCTRPKTCRHHLRSSSLCPPRARLLSTTRPRSSNHLRDLPLSLRIVHQPYPSRPEPFANRSYLLQLSKVAATGHRTSSSARIPPQPSAAATIPLRQPSKPLPRHQRRSSASSSTSFLEDERLHSDAFPAAAVPSTLPAWYGLASYSRGAAMSPVGGHTSFTHFPSCRRGLLRA